MQTSYTASAGDIVSFYWKVSSDSGDYLRFYIDDDLQSGSISGTDANWQKRSYALSAGSRTLKWVYEKDSSGSAGDDCGWVDGLYTGPSSGSLPPDPEGLGAYSESVDSSLKFTSSGDGSWINVAGSTWDYYYDGDSVMGRDTDANEQAVLQAIVESDNSETVKFWWKVSCAWYTDFLRFYIDGTEEAFITGDEDWQEESFTVSSGIHTLKWVYEDGGGNDGENCGWVDFVQWTGPSPAPDPNNWNQIEYKYDVYGRRSEKKVDGYATRYVYDGPQVIAEYDGNNNLLRKYIYGPGIDQPVSMIEVADGNAAYYYHYDALGSVIALSDSTGDTVQTYEYSTFGEPAVEDSNHPNPYMFAGRRYDVEIGLYYNRARYYNPYTGRFLQTDPIGYADGINWYAYCGNNPVRRVDPSGLEACDPCECECDPCDDPWEDLFYSQVFEGDGIIHVVEATERIMVIPGILQNPDAANTARITAITEGFSWVFKVAGWIPSSRFPTVPTGLAGEYLGAVKHYSDEFNKIAWKFSKSGQAGYKAYIEVQEYEWKITGLIWKKYEKVPVGKPYWVEVRGYPGWYDTGIEMGYTDHYNGFTSSDTYGYKTEQDAWHAATDAISFYPDAPRWSFWSEGFKQKYRQGWCPACRKTGCKCL